MAFWTNSNGKILTLNGKSLINAAPIQTAPISTGGRFTLPNGDTLVIKEAWDRNQDFDEAGICFYLESGDSVCAFYYSVEDEYTYSSVYNFFSGDYRTIYSEGDILRIYSGENYEGESNEQLLRDQYSLHPLITLEIINDNWVVKVPEPYHQQIVNKNGTFDIYWNACCPWGEYGFYIIWSKGNATLTYYQDDYYGPKVQQSGYNWIGGYTIKEWSWIGIFDADFYDYDELNNMGYQEQYDYLINTGHELILKTWYDGTKWIDVT